ncbi:MAG: hypothetical protein AAF696_37660 [Bacteroidota bacterium]
MNHQSHFSIDQGLKSLRKRLSKSGAFTYDNIDELECHVLDGYELNRETYSEEEAFRLSMESLGDPEELTKIYYQSNQKHIWRNYFWVIAINSFLGFIVYQIAGVFFQLILLTMAKLNVPILYGSMDVGLGITAGSIFIISIFFFRKRAYSIFQRIVAGILAKPTKALLLLAIIPLTNSGLISNLVEDLMNEELSLFAQSAYEVYGIIKYIAPLLILFWSFWSYKKKIYTNFEEKLATRLGICAIIGVCMSTFVNLSAMILADGGMGLVSLMNLGIQMEVQLMIPILLFIGFWSLLIGTLYKQPQLILGKSSQFISRNTLIFLAISFALLIAVFFLADFSSSLLYKYLHAEYMGPYMEYTQIFMYGGFTFILLLLLSIWTYRRAKNRKLIAWD